MGEGEAAFPANPEVFLWVFFFFHFLRQKNREKERGSFLSAARRRLKFTR